MGGYPLPMSRLTRFATTGVVAATSATLITGCSSKETFGFGFDPGLSSVNDITLPLWQGAWIAALVVGAFTAGLIFWAMIFHRKKDENFPKQTRYNIPTEIAYTVIPFLIVAVLFGYTAVAETNITKISPATSTAVHDINVNAIQWSWQFNYKEAGPGTTITGTPANPPVLYMPLGERVRFSLTSSDVDHGFWIPAFMIQMMNLPGVENHLEFSANKLGTFPGRCNMLCGRNHSQMLFTVKVVTPSEYATYIANLKVGQK